jgi:mono/diheme cytochrome c family protein
MRTQALAAGFRLLLPGRAIPARTVLIALSWVIASPLTPGAWQGRASAGPPAPAPQPDLASQVHAIFSVKCTQCHGADVRRPGGKFGYVLDLQRVASNPKMVVPFKPEESNLWALVRDKEMPADGAKAGPLTAEQIEVIRAWIASGAPAATLAAPPSVSSSMSDVPGGTSEPSQAPGSGKRLLRWLGKFHVVVIHFAIGSLMAAALGEMWCAWRGGRAPWPPVRFCVLLGAAGAVAAVLLGWLHADIGGYGAGSPQALRLHRWLGTTAGVWGVGLALLSEVDARRQRRSHLFRVALWVGALLVGVTGHFGGTLVHGDDFFDW